MAFSLKQVFPLTLKDQLQKRSSELWLNDIQFAEQKYYFIEAASGKGKSTFIHSLYGIRNDYEGGIQWNNKDLKQFTKEDLSQCRTNEWSIVFQDLRLFDSLTAFENLEIKRLLTANSTATKAFEMMERLGIAPKKNQIVGTLSYGERQRLAIVRALLQPFKVILLDEPFSHLDEQNSRIAAQLILEQVQQNAATLIHVDLDAHNYFPYHKTILL